MSYYKIIKGIAYDRSLIEKANELTQGQGDGRISEADIQTLWEFAQDGGRITNIEQRTLLHIAKTLNATDKASSWLSEQAPEEKGYEAIIRKVIRQRLGLSGLKWSIAEENIKEQEALENQQTFEQALFEAVEAFLYEVESSTSMRDIISVESGIDWEDVAEISQAIRNWMNQGMLYLIPSYYPQAQENGNFPFKAPNDGWSTSEFWIFGLGIPGQTEYNFVSLVRRQGFEQAFSYGYISQSPNSQETIRNIIVNNFRLQEMEWQIPHEEIKIQQKLEGVIDFPQALRLAISSFINDDNDEESPRSLVKEVHWEEGNPDNFELPWAYQEFLNRKVLEYMDDGIIYLVPKAIHELDADDYEDVYPPENGEQVNKNWIFMLQLPTLSDHIFWAIVDRTGVNPTYSYGFN